MGVIVEIRGRRQIDFVPHRVLWPRWGGEGGRLESAITKYSGRKLTLEIRSSEGNIVPLEKLNTKFRGS